MNARTVRVVRWEVRVDGVVMFTGPEFKAAEFAEKAREQWPGAVVTVGKKGR